MHLCNKELKVCVSRDIHKLGNVIVGDPELDSVEDAPFTRNAIFSLWKPLLNRLCTCYQRRYAISAPEYYFLYCIFSHVGCFILFYTYFYKVVMHFFIMEIDFQLHYRNNDWHNLLNSFVFKPQRVSCYLTLAHVPSKVLYFLNSVGYCNTTPFNLAFIH